MSMDSTTRNLLRERFISKIAAAAASRSATAAAAARLDTGYCSDNDVEAVLLNAYAMVAVDQAKKSIWGAKSRLTYKQPIQREKQQKAAGTKEAAAAVERRQLLLLVFERLAALEKVLGLDDKGN
jgi:hypothetical protein